MLIHVPYSLKKFVGSRKRNRGISTVIDGAAAIKKATAMFAENDEARIQGEYSFPEKYELVDDPNKFMSWVLHRKFAESDCLTKSEANNVFKYFWPRKWAKYTPDEIWLVDKLCAVTPIKQGKEDKRTKHSIVGVAMFGEDGTKILMLFKSFIASKRIDLKIRIFDTLLHELAHFLDFMHPYMRRIATQKVWLKICRTKETPASLYMAWVLDQGQSLDRAVGEEFADSLSYYLMTTSFFRMTRPKRTKFIENLIKK